MGSPAAALPKETTNTKAPRVAAARLPPGQLARIKALAAAMSAKQAPGLRRISASDALRVVVELGLPVAEASFGLGPSPSSPAPAEGPRVAKGKS